MWDFWGGGLTGEMDIGGASADASLFSDTEAAITKDAWDVAQSSVDGFRQFVSCRRKKTISEFSH